MGDLSGEAKKLLEAEVLRVLVQEQGELQKTTLESISGHHDFLVKTTKLVLAGFFGLLTIFGTLLVWLVGSKLDDLKKDYVDVLIGQRISELTDERIRAEIDVLSKAVLEELAQEASSKADLLKEEIAAVSLSAKDAAVTAIDLQVRASTDKILSDQIALDIQQAVASFNAERGVAESLVPTGAITAFLRECPDGWSPYAEVSGRVIVGAGEGPGLTKRLIGELGGEELQTLGDAELPRHTHAVRDPGHSHVIQWGHGPSVGNRVQERSSGRGDTGAKPTTDRNSTGLSIDYSGEGQAFSRMPPFLVLQFCVKR